MQKLLTWNVALFLGVIAGCGPSNNAAVDSETVSNSGNLVKNITPETTIWLKDNGVITRKPREPITRKMLDNVDIKKVKPRRSRMRKFGTENIETPSGPRDVHNLTQIPRDVPLVFDETLNRVYEYFSYMKDCDAEPDLDKKDRCLSQMKSIYGDLWGDNDPARNRFSGNIKFTDPLVPTYASSEFKWRLTLHGLLDNFVINTTSYFPSHIDDELVTLYLDHLENNDVIKRLPVRAEGEPRYKVQSLESLRRIFPEFKLSDYMPKNHRAGPVLSGHEFTMFFGKKNSEVHEMWSTNYYASNCKRGRLSSFYKIKIGYESAWLREYMGGRNVATIYVCAPYSSALPQVTVLKLE